MSTAEVTQTCDVTRCGHPAVILLANDAPLLNADYREWYACRWHQRNVAIPADDLALPPASEPDPSDPTDLRVPSFDRVSNFSFEEDDDA